MTRANFSAVSIPCALWLICSPNITSVVPSNRFGQMRPSLSIRLLKPKHTWQPLTNLEWRILTAMCTTCNPQERHIGEAIIDTGDALTNLHMAYSNRAALGEGSMDLDTVIMALYVIGHNQPGCFVTPELLGACADPYPAMYGLPDQQTLEYMVQQSVTYFREREEAVLSI